MKRQPRDPYRDNLVNRRSELYKNNPEKKNRQQLLSHTTRAMSESVNDEKKLD